MSTPAEAATAAVCARCSPPVAVSCPDFEGRDAGKWGCRLRVGRAEPPDGASEGGSRANESLPLAPVPIAALFRSANPHQTRTTVPNLHTLSAHTHSCTPVRTRLHLSLTVLSASSR